jgi:hypothetical protein
MVMASKAMAVKAVEAVGGSIDWGVSEITSSEKVITIDAPDGHLWEYNGCECICIAWYSGSAAEFWAEVIDAVKLGVDTVAVL